MAIKQVPKGASSIAKNFKPGFGTYALAGAGIMAAFGGMKWLANPGQSVKSPDGENPYSAASFKDAGYLQRMSRLAALGMATPAPGGAGAGVGNAVSNIVNYHTERAKDIFATTVGGETGLSSSFMGGAKWGGIAGAATGMVASIASWGRIPFTKSVPVLGVLGAVAGGYGARKVNLDIIRSVNEAKKNSLNKRRMSNRGKMVGPGFRSWSNQGRRIGKPGHLGMDGSVPFSMHKARNRSTV
tara:strand:- start:1097 stop:1822 length:726 start_codon:yes stop_codon:yes gene_type:complete